MSEDRLWKFRRPEWMHSAWFRNAGVYTAGGLVRLPSLSPSSLSPRFLCNHTPRYNPLPSR